MAGNAPQGRHQAPARGVLAGIKADAQRAKDLNQPFDPNSIGSAWSHNFLNQKPWHPLNFRNQARVYEAEQQAIRDKKTREQAKSEFEAEQEYMKTLSYLSVEEQERHRSRQSVSFLYTKPPGMDVDVTKPKQEGAQGGEGAGDKGRADHGPGGEGRPRERWPPREGRSHVVDMLGAIAALHSNDKWEVKHSSAAGKRSPLRGDVDPGADNQQFVLPGSDEDEEGDDGDGPAEPCPAHESRKERKRRELEEAEAVLRGAGLLEAATKLHGGGKDKAKKKKKKSREEDEEDGKRKKSKKHKSKDS